MATKDFILLIPCFNNPEGISRSIKSIHYPADKFEVLIVDDGSAIPLSLKDLQAINPEMTIQIIRLEQNQGIVKALNTGLKALKDRTDYRYIARLDAGDTCHSERFTKQVEFLDKHPDVSLLGTWCRFENKKTGEGYDYITRTKHEDIVKEMHYKCSFIHPTVMFKKQVLESIGFYPENYAHVEDYAYFWQILKSDKSAILPQKLLVVDFSDEHVSSKNYKKQLMNRIRVVNKFGTSDPRKFLGAILLLCRFLAPIKVIKKIKSFR